MKPEQLYQELKDLAEKLDITVLEHNFRSTGVKAQSGFCKIKDKDHYILDKHKKIQEKNELLGDYLSHHNLEAIFMVPAVRDFLKRFQSLEKEKGFHIQKEL